MIANEVKGEIVDFNPAAGWSQNDRRIDSPFRQASDASHRLSDHLRVAPSTRTYHYPFGHAVWFPDADNTAVAVQLDAPEETVLGRPDLNGVEQAIRSLFDYWFSHEPEPPGLRGVEALCQLLARGWTFRPLLGGDVKLEAKKMLELTERQYAMLTFLGERPRALISGCAGSGKTVLAIEKARRLALNGFAVLFTCFNRKLAEQVRANLEGSGVHALDFHEVCDKLGREAGVQLPPRGSKDLPADYFSDVLPDALSQAARRLGPQYDAIVVDEGQDFHGLWWIPLQELLRDPERGVLYVFFDVNQAIFADVKQWPISDEPFRLSTNCRNTKTIHEAVVATLGDTVDATCGGLDGRPIERIQVADEAAERRELRKVLHRLIHEEQLAASDVVVLTPRKKGRSAWDEGATLGNLHLTWEDRSDHDAVQVSTIHSFKGLERPVAILTELSHLYSDTADELLYVARSRPTSHLIELWRQM